jgi:cobalt-zinc-cadmium efflux system membrane fusion protein
MTGNPQNILIVSLAYDDIGWIEFATNMILPVIAGTIINGHLIVGEYVPENQWVFVVADLSEVWADFFVPISQGRLIHQGQVVEVSTGTADESVTGMVSYIAPYVDERSQAQTVRVVLPNQEARFMPGMFVTGNLVTSEREVPVAVRRSGIQTFRDWQVVFFKQGDTYEIRPLTLGRTDGEWIEVLSGISAGEQYVSGNSYTVKADILKSGASHDH